MAAMCSCQARKPVKGWRWRFARTRRSSTPTWERSMETVAMPRRPPDLRRNHAGRPVGSMSDDYGVEVGKSADLVVLDCQDRESAVAEVVTPLYGFKRG